MEQVVLVDQKTKKLLRLVKVSARLARDRERYQEALKALAKTMPRELRSAIAKYTATLRRTIQDPSPENLRVLGELALKKRIELNSWRVENREKRKVVSQIAKAFYSSLNEVSKLANELEQEFANELELVE